MTDAPLTRRERRERERLEAERAAREAAERAAGGAAGVDGEAAAAVPQPEPAPQAEPAPEPQRPLTRRELRELERARAAAAAGAGGADDAPAADPVAAAPAPAAEPAASAVDPTVPQTAVLPAIPSQPPERSAEASADVAPAPGPARSAGSTALGRRPASPLFPEVAAPLADREEPVLQWNPQAGPGDAPRRSRSTFGLPADEGPLPVVRSTRQAPPPGSPKSEIDDYFARLVEAAEPSEPPTGALVMPSELDLDRTDGLARGAISGMSPTERVDRALAAGAVHAGWFDSLNVDPAVDPEADPDAEGIDDPADAQLGYTPRLARSAVSADSETGFTAPEGDLAADRVHVRTTAQPAGPERAAQDPSQGELARPGQAEDARLSTAIKVAAGGFAAAVAAAAVVVWGVVQGWFR